ncbi:MAG: hypothetical protein HRT86_15435 [Ilumatobacteraceae bacterium]|nr:hypothetical protein [Ilumatobacteraceae bacterium]
MSELQNEIKSIEVHMKDAIEKVQLGDDLAALMKNRAFKRLITERYFKDEPARLVMLKACPNAQSDDVQKEIEKDITAIGGLFQFFCAIEGEANAMRHAIESDKQMIEALEAEDE